MTVWADDDSLETILHTNFNLNKDTGFLMMSTVAALLDSVSFSGQMADTSWGRYPNGTGSFQLMNTTYGQQNDGSPLGIPQYTHADPSLKLYPNPANTEMLVTFSGKKQIEVYSVFGTKVNTFSGNGQILVNTARYANGLYFVKCGKEVVKFAVRH